MKLSFVIPAYNEETYIGRCLESIFQATQGKPDAIEVVVVNNASTDRTKAVAQSFSGVKVVDEPRKGLSQARQTGFVNSTGDLVAHIDADTILPRDWPDKVFRVFTAKPDLVAYSGPFIYYDLSFATNFWVRLFYYMSYINYLFFRYILRRSSMLQGGNYVCRRTALLQVGGINTDFVFYGEDADVAHRLSKIGSVVFSFDLPIYASGRRLQDEGALFTAAKYVINYFWTILFKKPFHKKFTDVRP